MQCTTKHNTQSLEFIINVIDTVYKLCCGSAANDRACFRFIYMSLSRIYESVATLEELPQAPMQSGGVIQAEKLFGEVGRVMEMYQLSELKDQFLLEN